MWFRLFVIFFVLAQFVYLWLKQRNLYFKDAGIPYLEPKLFYGNAKTLGKTEDIGSLVARVYNELKGRQVVAGMFSFMSPVIIVTDLEFLKNVLVRDFPYFMNRGLYVNEKDDPLSAHLFSIDGQQWRDMRRKLSPTFTSGKMKFMFATMVAVADEFTKCVDKERLSLYGVEMKEILARFTTDVIGSCAFGLECDSLKNPNAIFRQMGRKVFSEQRLTLFQRLLLSAYPEFGKKIGIKSISDDVSAFFLKCVHDTVEYRQKNNIVKNDFLNLVLDLGKDNPEEGLTINEIAAQAFVFFLAGFETSSTTMSYAMYEIALNQDIQNKAREEIKSVLARYDGKMTYDAMMEMKYIEQIINESLRKYPPVPVLLRRVVKDYAIEDTKIVLEGGKRLMVPVLGIHRDPNHYPNPDVFDPDRFTPEETAKRHPYAFLPFGEGPRNCIGLRFGMMQARLGLASLLHNFRFTMNEKTEQPIKFMPKGFILTSRGGMWLNVEKN